MPVHEPPTPRPSVPAEHQALAPPRAENATVTRQLREAPAPAGPLAALLQRAVLARAKTKDRSRSRSRSPSPPRVSFKERVKRTARLIAGGHGYRKHIRDFRSIASRADYADRVFDVMMHAGFVRHLSGGRTAYYDDTSNTLVLTNPNDPDGGTMFKPTGGYSYVRRLR